MKYNAVQLHEKVKFWLDTTRSPRFTPTLIDSAINTAIANIVMNRFVPNENSGDRQGSRGITGIQRNLKLRNELMPLVLRTEPLTPGGDLASGFTVARTSLPVDFNCYVWFELLLSNGMKVYPLPITFEELERIANDPYSRLNSSYPIKSYFVECNGNYNFYCGIAVASVRVMYLKKPTTVFFGFETTVSNVSVNTPVILSQNESVINGTIYKIGDEFNRPTTVDNPTALVVYGSATSDLPDSLFDEIASDAAAALLLSVGKGEKSSAVQ